MAFFQSVYDIKFEIFLIHTSLSVDSAELTG